MSTPFTDIVLCELYGFNAGLFDNSLMKRIKSALEGPARLTETLYFGHTVGAELHDPQDSMGDGLSILNVLHHFDRKYLYPEFRDLRWSTRYLLPPFGLQIDGAHQEAQGLLTLHESGVGTVLFLLNGLTATDGSGLKRFVTLHRRPFPVTLHERTNRLCAARGYAIPATASLDGVFLRYLRLLAPELVGTNSIRDDAKEESANLEKSMVNRYQFISLDGVSGTYDDIQKFVDEHRKDLIDAAEAYSYFEEPRFSFSASRTPQALEAAFAPTASVRRHLQYQMNPYRLLAVSALGTHPEVYDYAPLRPWYSSYLGMIELVFSQFEALYLIHGELWRNPRPRAEAVSLEETFFLSLADYLNARVIDHPQGRKFMARLRDVLSVEEYYGVVEARLNLQHTIAVERYNEQQAVVGHALEQAGTAVTTASFVLALILAFPAAEVFYSVFLAPTGLFANVWQKPLMVLALWALTGAFIEYLRRRIGRVGEKQ